MIVKQNQLDVKIAFVSSSGGHYEQLKMLKPLMNQYESVVITEKTDFTDYFKGQKYYFLTQVNRKEPLFIFKYVGVIVQSLIVLIKENPNLIISTGALSTIPLCVLGKVFKKKIIFIESFSKINSPTLTGKFLYKFADVFYVQWEEMLEIYPKARYKGKIY